MVLHRLLHNRVHLMVMPPGSGRSVYKREFYKPIKAVSVWGRMRLDVVKHHNSRETGRFLGAKISDKREK